jgi:hypothetical protein
MLIIVLASLIIKRQFFEKSKRTWRVWLMDVSKQLSGQAVVHMSNLLVRCWDFTCDQSATLSIADSMLCIRVLCTDGLPDLGPSSSTWQQ